MEALLAGLHEAGRGVAFFIAGNADDIQVLVALQEKPPGSATLLEKALGGVFPGIRVVDAHESDVLNCITGLGQGLAMTGIPAAGTPNGGPTRPRDSVDRIVRAMAGTRWCYLVLAMPVVSETVAATFQAVAEEERTIVASYMRPGVSGVERENNPEVKHYVGLLGKMRQRLARGRANGMWEVRACLFTDSEMALAKGRIALIAAFSGPEEQPEPLRLHRCVLAETAPPVPATLLNTTELAALAQFPAEEYPGYKIRPFARFAADVPRLASAPVVTVGWTTDIGNRKGPWLEVAVRDLAKHVFVGGQTGAGKTTAVMFLLSQLWREHRIPWLVIDPKEDYRSFIASSFGSDVRVFTLADERFAPLRFNPLMPQAGWLVQGHIGFVRALFNAAFVLYPPMPYILDKALHRVYQKMGWDLSSNTNRRGTGSRAFPTISDLADEVEAVVTEAGYDSELTGNIRAGLAARIDSLQLGTKGRMLDVRGNMSIEELLSTPTILETGGIGDPEEAAFLLGSFLIALYEYRKASGASEDLKHVLVLEEAHRLLQQSAAADLGPDRANPRAAAIERFCEMLAELRAYGQGIVVCEQIPSKIVPDVVKNAGLKLLFRTSARDDRDLIGAAMNMDEAQKACVAALRPGEAVASTEGADRPFLIRLPDVARQVWREPRPTSPDVSNHMRRVFYGPRHVNLDRFDRCAECSARSLCGEVQPAVSAWLASARGREAFDRLSVALVSGRDVLRAFGEFTLAAASTVAGADLPSATAIALCAARQAAQQTLETRGRLFAWDFETVDTLAGGLGDVCQAAATVVVHSGESEGPGMEQLAESYRSAYRKACARAPAWNSLCGRCAHRCLYRLEVMRLMAPVWPSDGRQQSCGSLVTGDDLATFAARAVQAASRLTHPEDHALLEVVARCWAGRIVGEHGLVIDDEKLAAAIVDAAARCLYGGQRQ
jgi:hypothetical protein